MRRLISQAIIGWHMTEIISYSLARFVISGKKNYFPLLNNSQRALSHHNNIEDEQPVIIHPANENSENFITFKEEIPVSVDGNVRGKVTILKLGLDRELLNEQRRKMFNTIRNIYDLAKGYPDTNLI